MKKYNHSRHYGNRLNWRALVISGTLLACLVTSNYSNQEVVYTAEVPQPFMEPVIVEVAEPVKEETIEEKFQRYFPRSHKTMLAIAKAESGMKMESKGYNCYYYQGMATTTPIKNGSKACKVQDRPLAHSVDCFILQDNQPKSTVCPEGVSVDQHLEEMAELSKICGLECWWAYKNKSYLAHMD